MYRMNTLLIKLHSGESKRALLKSQFDVLVVDYGISQHNCVGDTIVYHYVNELVSVNFGSGNSLVPSGNKVHVLPEPKLTQMYVAIWRYQFKSCHTSLELLKTLLWYICVTQLFQLLTNFFFCEVKLVHHTEKNGRQKTWYCN